MSLCHLTVNDSSSGKACLGARHCCQLPVSCRAFMTPELETANRVDDFGCQLTADINSCGMSGVKEWTTIGWDSSLKYTYTSLVSLPQATKSSCTDMPTKLRWFLWPVKVRTSEFVVRSHMRSVESVEADTTWWSEIKSTYDIALLCPWNVLTGDMGRRKSYTRTVWSADPTATVYADTLLYATLHTLTLMSSWKAAACCLVDHTFTLPSSEPETAR
mmetsp:Transcript_36352/g.91805  ORF Transcript_36352/g.91805 Transcript_36352/m.91805 type:complete len:217 (+) Transcript_36352:52-702(+)